jgi:hypothetical protein
MMSCGHETFQTDVAVNRLSKDEGGPINAFSAEIQIHCVDCGEKFRWNCSTVGMLSGEPAISLDGLTLNAPLRPASADDDFGLAIPGFRVNVKHNG